MQQLAPPKIEFYILEDYLMTRAAVRAKTGPCPLPLTIPTDARTSVIGRLVPTETDIVARSVSW
jgi:hypothetical protein